MDVVNVSRSRRFLRERPIHVKLFDRPRIVVELLCLEPAQEESRRGFERSDSLLLITEGEARLRAGPQIESLQAMDAVLVPPGQEYLLSNTGRERLTAVVILTPKPSRAGELRVPGDTRPARTARPERGDAGGERPSSSRPRSGYGGRSAPPAGPGAAPQRGRRPPEGGRPPRRGEGEGPAWYPRPKPAWRPRDPIAPPGSETPQRRRNAGEVAPRQGRDEGPPGSARPKPRGGRPDGQRAGPGPRADRRGKDTKKTGAARRASRGQGPLSGRRGPGRSGPRT